MGGELPRGHGADRANGPAVVARAVLPLSFAPMQPAMRDFKAAAHVREVEFADVPEVQLEFAEEDTAGPAMGAEGSSSGPRA